MRLQLPGYGKKATDSQKKQFITVLNSKRSNAINIGLTVLPQPETIKQAVLHMDSLVLTKENVEVKRKQEDGLVNTQVQDVFLGKNPFEAFIDGPDRRRDRHDQRCQRASPDTPLGSAEDFLMMLASVGALEARLKLWIFKIDYDNQEEEIAEHLADLKTGIDDLQKSKTFMYILAALRAVGNFLNGANVEGFHIEYLSKVSEVKDTSSSKQSLLFHLCSIIREQFPESTDFFSEIGSIKRCAKVDFDELETNLLKLEEECKASWEHLELIYTKHTMSREFYRKTKDLLTDCAQKILVLKVVHVRVLNRFQKLLLFLGMNATAAQELKVTDFCSIVSEFALEYRTIRERHIEIEKKKEDHKKRNKTRGKMITEKFLSKEKAEDAQLKALLTTRGRPGDETLESRTRARPSNRRGQSMRLVDPEEDEQTDELLTMLVKTRKDSASSRPPRKRERARHSNRKSLRRTLKSGLTDAEKAALGLMPKSPTIKV
ncbi:putative FH1/FH2 domain-containing protein 3 [Apostichopus japonicus]|uniref:Putative FH1/FH2 domain-containing protein 3 n=1 Tax=Stichopus japonicus TaxID=307972 RepID=A0A2G8JFK9_STIJA|nr:putative FH1/FH2 domain-containing protein 3 [Apostichopus japonicus]